MRRFEQADGWDLQVLMRGYDSEPLGYFYDKNTGKVLPNTPSRDHWATAKGIGTYWIENHGLGEKEIWSNEKLQPLGEFTSSHDALLWVKKHFPNILVSCRILFQDAPIEWINHMLVIWNEFAHEWPNITDRIEWILAEHIDTNEPAIPGRSYKDIILNKRFMLPDVECEDQNAKLIADGQRVSGASNPKAQVAYAFAQNILQYALDRGFELSFLPVYDDSDGFGLLAPTFSEFLAKHNDDMRTLSQLAQSSIWAAWGEAFVNALYGVEQTNSAVVALDRFLVAVSEMEWLDVEQAKALSTLPLEEQAKWGRIIQHKREELELESPLSSSIIDAPTENGEFVILGQDDPWVDRACILLLGNVVTTEDWGALLGIPDGSVVRLAVRQNDHTEFDRTRFHYYKGHTPDYEVPGNTETLLSEGQGFDVFGPAWDVELTAVIINRRVFADSVHRVIRINNHGRLELLNDQVRFRPDVSTSTALTMAAKQIQAALRFGIEEVHAFGDGDISTVDTARGYYALPLIGYNAPLEPQDFECMTTGMRAYCEQHGIYDLHHLFLQDRIDGLDPITWWKQYGTGRHMYLPLHGDRENNLALRLHESYARRKGVSNVFLRSELEPPVARQLTVEVEENAFPEMQLPDVRDGLSREWFNGRFDVILDPKWHRNLQVWQQKCFGRVLDPEEWGQLVGAPDRASVNVSFNGAGVLIVTDHPFYDGKQIREVIARPGRIEVYNRHFQLVGTPKDGNPTYYEDVSVQQPPLDFDKHVFGFQLQKAIELGVDAIHVNAAGHANSAYHGYYSWARMGFNAPLTRDDYNLMPDVLRKAMLRAEVFDLNDIMLNEYRYPEFLAWWKQHGCGRRMSIRPHQDSVAIWVQRYFQAKRGFALSYTRSADTEPAFVQPEKSIPRIAQVEEGIALAPEDEVALSRAWEWVSHRLRGSDDR